MSGKLTYQDEQWEENNSVAWNSDVSPQLESNDVEFMKLDWDFPGDFGEDANLQQDTSSSLHDECTYFEGHSRDTTDSGYFTESFIASEAEDKSWIEEFTNIEWAELDKPESLSDISESEFGASGEGKGFQSPTYPCLDEISQPRSGAIIRPPFPKPIQERSPVVGLSASILIRTCFRTGEAFNAGVYAVKQKQTVFLEIYARVIDSWRDGSPSSSKQHFILGDLFSDRAPLLRGTYDSWRGVDLWEYDSQAFLSAADQQRMCRCVSYMKRDGDLWKLVIQNIWEATWDDVEYAKGIICAG